MSRSIADAEVAAAPATIAGPGVAARFEQSANAADLEARVAAALAAQFGAGAWLLTHFSLAGAGSGGLFTCAMLFADSGVLGGSTGLQASDSPAAFFFQGSNKLALPAARQAAQVRAADQFFGGSAHVQSFLKGSQLGTRYMGCELFIRVII